MPHYLALTNPEKTAFSNFVSKKGAADRVALAQVLIEKHGDVLNKENLFNFLKGANNKSVAHFETLTLEELNAQIQSKKVSRPAQKRKQASLMAQGAFGVAAGVPGYAPGELGIAMGEGGALEAAI